MDQKATTQLATALYHHIKGRPEGLEAFIAKALEEERRLHEGNFSEEDIRKALLSGVRP